MGVQSDFESLTFLVFHVPWLWKFRPLQDLVYKGIVKVTYDRGYAMQTKSLLLENTTTAADAIVQLFDALGLRGSPSDYALEERNIVTGGKTLLSV